MSELTSGEQTFDHELLAELADDFTRRYRGGEHPSLEEYTEKYPALASQIRDLFPGLLMMEKWSLHATFNIAPAGERVGALIGRYKLLERMGEGGFGTVFMAEQLTPMRRKVALKVLKPGVDTKQVIVRFEAERQALAMMDHENIAKVLDAGATDTGRPYFVMELVPGIPITDYCDKNQLTPTDRLGLFMQVCRAVQHAHTKGIIHRDIKPTNVLVTLHDGVPVPKVIDFGVAKATGQQALTEQTLFTQFAQMVGTPLYMSPEQAELSGLDMDTRSDIYSLGVLLYELLTGTTPFDKDRLRRAAHDEVRRIIREEEPPSPSTRISTLGNKLDSISADRKTEPTRLGPRVRGDLDWIVMKAMEKDRRRRYETVSGLAADVQRHLDNEPVLARAPSCMYRLHKLVARNKLTVTAVTALVTVLLLGVTISVWQAARANTALANLREAAPAFAAQARALAARERFDEAIDKYDYAAHLQPDVPEYLIAQGDLLESQLRLIEAARAYRAALRLSPDDARVKANIALCDQLQTESSGSEPAISTLSHESLRKLYAAMLKEQRPAAELMLVARRLGEERTHLVELWIERLGTPPIAPGNPLEKRLTLRPDGLLALDLGGTNVSGLAALQGMPLGELNLSHCADVSNIQPLHGLPLKKVVLRGTRVSDLSPLHDASSLTWLDLLSTSVTDLSPLRGKPLQTLYISNTAVVDLTPLTGMPLQFFECGGIPATDYSPLAGRTLQQLYLGPYVHDLSFLRGAPIKLLYLTTSREVRNLSVLSEIKTLERLYLPPNAFEFPPEEIAAIGALRDHPSLLRITADPMGTNLTAMPTKDEFFPVWDRYHDWGQRLREAGIRFQRARATDGTWSVMIHQPTLDDLSIFDGLPISDLDIDGTGVSDLTKLKGLPLHRLVLNNNPGVNDLTPLKDMRLDDLHLHGTGVRDLRPLQKMPLTTLVLSECKALRDISPLAAIPTLVTTILPIQISDLEPLRQLPKLRWIRLGSGGNPAITTSETFWKTWDGLPWARKLEAAGVNFRVEQDLDGMYQVWLYDRTFRDCSIFRGSYVRRLSLDGTSVSDLSPLMELPLEDLSIRDTPITDISPLRSAVLRNSLVHFWARNTRLADLSPLAECANLDTADLGYTGLRDLRVLTGLKQLRMLWIQGSPQITDISLLGGMSLEHIDLSATGVTDVSPLLKCPTLKFITLPENARNVEVLKDLPNLEFLSYLGGAYGVATQKTADFWNTWKEDAWLRALHEKGLKYMKRRLADGTWELILDDQPITDLSVLKGSPVTRLSLMGTPVSDLTPLRGMPLTVLRIAATNVTDIRPLEGMPLEQLQLGATAVSDLSPIRGMKLKLLFMAASKQITDLSALKEMTTLERLLLPPNSREFEFLRAMTRLEQISFKFDSENRNPSQTAAEFWAEYDRRKAAPATQPERSNSGVIAPP